MISKTKTKTKVTKNPGITRPKCGGRKHRSTTSAKNVQTALAEFLVLPGRAVNVMYKPGKHIPVLLNEVLQYLDPQEGESYLDLTAGYGGHAGAILERTLQIKNATLVDRDEAAVSVLRTKFAAKGAEIIRSDFLSASRKLKGRGESAVEASSKRPIGFDMILADLGVSSAHLDEEERGFSFRGSGPLDMRMDRTQELTAADIVNDYSQADLKHLIKTYGQEPRAGKIAEAIARSRPFDNTSQLAETISAAVGGRTSRIHPATRTFQALRIAVNDEINQLEQALQIWLDLLAPGGRLAVISFHSLEDRLVKRVFKEVSGDRYDSTFHLLTKKPVSPDKEELVFNPRSRSAKLRAVAKIKIGRSRYARTGKRPLQNL